jgi:hypothetical protein
METVLPAIYRSNDPIDNLLVRISLRRRIPPASSSQSLLLSTHISSAGASVSSDETSGQSIRASNFDLKSSASPRALNDNSILETTASFSWQQKVYSPKELLRFAAIIEHKRSHDQIKSSPMKMLNESIHDMVNAATGHESLIPKNAIEESYVKDIETRLENGEPIFESTSPVLLFTYVDADEVIPSNTRSFQSGREHIGAFSGISESVEGTDLSITNAVLDPTHSHSRATTGSFKEHPFSTMYIMAALSVDTDAFRARQNDCKMTEVCLAVIRAYKNSSSLLVEMRPGFASPVPYDKASLIALSRSISGDSSSVISGSLAAQKLVEADTRLGNGHFGGSLRLKMLPTLHFGISTEKSTASSSAHPIRSLNSTISPSNSGETFSAPLITNERSTDICAYAIEMHRFSLPDGSQYEYSVTNVDEDIGQALKAAAFSAGSSLSPYLQKVVDSGALNPGGERFPTADINVDDNKDLGESTLTAMRQNDQESIELDFHRLGSEFFSQVPRSLLTKNIRSFKLSYYLEIVAAAKFYDSDAVYLTYELQLPKGSGWRILPLTDIPERHHTIAEKKKENGGIEEVIFRGSGFPDDNGVLDQDNHDSHWDHDVLLRDKEEELQDARSMKAESELDENASMSAKVNPDKRALAKKRQSLRSTPIQGVTQVACFVARPWTFGIQSASLPSGHRPFGSEGAAGSVDAFVGFKSSEMASNSDVAGASQSFANGHPFGFESTSSSLAPGHARLAVSNGKVLPLEHSQKLSSGGVTTRSSTRSLSGLGSSSLLSGVTSNNSFGSSGTIATTSSAPPSNSSFECVSIPQTEIVPVAHIGYPLELHLVCDLSSVQGGPKETSGTGGIPSPPVLFISVMSRDNWDRHKSCGYLYIDLPITAGIKNLVATCWKPKGSSAQAESDFYLGGSTRLAGISYARVPSENFNTSEEHSWSSGIEAVGPSQENTSSKPESEPHPSLHVNHLSRFGFETETTGEIGLRCCSIIQRGSQPIRMINQSAQLSQVSGHSRTGSSSEPSYENNRSSYSKGPSSTAKSVDDVLAKARSLRRRDRGKAQVDTQTNSTPARSSREYNLQ